jgi:hypothetical protein
MASVGDARLIFELGPSSRFVAHVPLKGDVTATKALELLPKVTAELQAALRRIEAREGPEKEEAPGVEAEG